MSLTPLPLKQCWKNCRNGNTASLMATVKWSQVKSWPNISDEARFSLRSSLHNFGGSLLLLSPTAPPALEFIPHPVFIYQCFPLPPSSAGHLFSSHLGRNPFCTSSTFCTQRVTTWTEPSIRLICSSIPLLHSLSFLKTPFQGRSIRKTILSCKRHYLTVNAFFLVLQLRI